MKCDLSTLVWHIDDFTQYLSKSYYLSEFFDDYGVLLKGKKLKKEIDNIEYDTKLLLKYIKQVKFKCKGE